MPPKFRKAMADQERLKTLAFREDLARRRRMRRHDRAYYIAALLWAILAALPSYYVGRPIPFTVGSAAPHDLHSRVEFSWRVNTDDQALVNTLEARFDRRYREEPLAQWAKETHGPVDEFLIRIASAYDIEGVRKAAEELRITDYASAEQIEAFARDIDMVKNDPHHYLVSPIKEILDNEIFPQGIIDPNRFELERGRSIRVTREDSSYTVLVGGEKGPITPAQVGAILERRFKVKLSAWFSDEFKNALRDILVKRMKPNLVYDETGSKAALAKDKEELLSRERTVKQNEILVSRGSIVTLEKLTLLRAEERVFRESQGWRLSLVRFLGNLFLFAAVSFSVVTYFKTVEGRRLGTRRRFFATLLLCLLPVIFGYVLIYLGAPGTMLPIGLAVGIAAFGMGSWAAIFLSSILSLCGLILFEGRADLMVGHLGAGLFFIITATRCRWRIALIIISLFAGIVGALAFISWGFARGDLQSLFVITSWSQLLDDSRASLISAFGLVLNWVACGILILILIPLIERYFHVTTRIHLQDLAAQEHPVLRRLIIEAPGTYHHSSVVSTLAEAAANAIGADGLRARIGGLFHDIGKLLKPEYFTENEFGVSRHESMNPNMSALLIINHVRDGAEMAKTFGLPNLVTDMIYQHHGDAVMKFFHNKAQQQAPAGVVVAREPFLYPGPKPQTPEAGVLMIADSVEAAVRSLDNPSPHHLRNLVARLIRDRLIEGQFEESGLSMRQLAQIEEVLFKMLVSMYHTRVKYPGQATEKQGRKR